MPDNSITQIDAQLLACILQKLNESSQYFPWSIIQPSGKAFDILKVIQTPVSGVGIGYQPGVETVVTTLDCPLGYDGIVLRVSNNFIGASINPGLPSMTWRIRNGISIAQSKFVEGYSHIITEFGTTEYPRETSGIHVTSGQRLIYTVTNNDSTLPTGPASQVACCFAGHFWPAQRD